jgi:ornithine cyclodeaminase/alanine dehydrogenase-like protein (mu-crystallin family)
MQEPVLRYLSATDVHAALPGIEERLQLAERTLLGLGEGAQLPPKIGVQPAPAGSFAHAMPALLRGREADGSRDLLGLKWVVGFPANVDVGLPSIHGTTILSDALTGRPRAILDAGALTAERTAAMSGLAVRRWGPPPGSTPRVAIVGAGVQARSHLPVLSHLLPGARVVLCDRELARAEALAQDLADPAAGLGSFGDVRTSSDAAEATRGSDVVLTMVSFGPRRQVLPEEAFGDSSLVVAIDYDMCVPAATVRRAGLFLVDHREQYLANRTETVFVGYPDAPMTIGDAIRDAIPRPAGRVIVTHLGVGLADIVFADAVLQRAEADGIGVVLEG